MKKPTDNHWKMNPDRAMAIQLAKRDVPSLVYNAVNLEGVAMTLPEVQTLLEGITVGGHKISDQNMALQQAAAWEYLFTLVNNSTFSFSRKVTLAIHAIAAKEEALAWGACRTGNITIGGAAYKPPAVEKLDEAWQALEEKVTGISDIYDQAITAFLGMARAQFFWDVNKRTGRFMMNGLLLQAGFPLI